MTNLETLRDLYRHMAWADAAVWSVVVASDAICADQSIRGRLFHLHQVQRLFLNVWKGAQPPLIDCIVWVWRGRPEPAWP